MDKISLFIFIHWTDLNSLPVIHLSVEMKTTKEDKENFHHFLYSLCSWNNVYIYSVGIHLWILGIYIYIYIMIYSPIWIIFFPATFILSDFILIYFHIYIYIYIFIWVCIGYPIYISELVLFLHPFCSVLV